MVEASALKFYKPPKIEEVIKEKIVVTENPFIDFPGNPNWKYVNVHAENLILNSDEKKEIFLREEIQGYIFNFSVVGSDKNITGILQFTHPIDKTTIEIPLSYRNLYLAGFTQGIGYVKLALYDPTLNRFTFIFEPQFPGIPFKGKIAFYLTNPTPNQQIIYTLDFNILQTT